MVTNYIVLIGALSLFAGELLWACGVFDCKEARGHRYGPVSDLCLNDGCDAERGSWKWCKGATGGPVVSRND